MVDVIFAHLCDTAIVGQDGKLSIIGIFDRIYAVSLPAVHDRLVLAFQIGPSYADIGSTFEVAVHCVDQDGQKVFEVKGNLKTEVAPGRTVRPGEKQRISQIIQVRNLQLQKAGSHDVNILINGEHRHTVSFDVVVLPPAPAR
jgi:hypothetical protein